MAFYCSVGLIAFSINAFCQARTSSRKNPTRIGAIEYIFGKVPSLTFRSIVARLIGILFITSLIEIICRTCAAGPAGSALCICALFITVSDLAATCLSEAQLFRGVRPTSGAANLLLSPRRDETHLQKYVDYGPWFHKQQNDRLSWMDGRQLVAWNLRRHRVERGLSQEKLAVDAQIDRTYESSLERGLENPTVSVIDKLAKRSQFLSLIFSESHRAESDLQSRFHGTQDQDESRKEGFARRYPLLGVKQTSPSNFGTSPFVTTRTSAPRPRTCARNRAGVGSPSLPFLQ